MTKPINPKQHASIDYATAGTFLAASAYYRQRNRAASTFALVNAGAIVMLSMLTDYPGDFPRG